MAFGCKLQNRQMIFSKIFRKITEIVLKEIPIPETSSRQIKLKIIIWIKNLILNELGL